MIRELRDKWVKALRSKRYKQGKGLLRYRDSDSLKNDLRYCCLGVLANVAGEKWGLANVDEVYELDGKAGLLSERMLNKVGLAPGMQDILTNLNDGDSYSPHMGVEEMMDEHCEKTGRREYNFDEIADYIEENVEVN